MKQTPLRKGAPFVIEEHHTPKKPRSKLTEKLQIKPQQTWVQLAPHEEVIRKVPYNAPLLYDRLQKPLEVPVFPSAAMLVLRFHVDFQYRKTLSTDVVGLCPTAGVYRYLIKVDTIIEAVAN